VTRITLCEAKFRYDLRIALMEQRAMYARTQNENGTFNTRCLYCFMTIAFAVETPEEMEGMESNHLCPEKVLAQLQAQESVRAPQAL